MDHGEREERWPIGASVTLDQLHDDPHPVLARLRRWEPVSWLPALSGWMVTSRALAQQVLRDDQAFTVDDPRFTTARVVGPSMLSLDGADHDRHRAPFNRAFRALPVTQDHRCWVSALARDMVDGLAPARSAELRQELAAPLAVAVITRFLKLADNRADSRASEQGLHQLILGWYRAIIGAVNDLTEGRAMDQAAQQSVAELRATVAATVANSGTDRGAGPTSLLAQAHAAGLSQTEVFANAAVMMFGAIETSEAMTSNALYQLLAHPAALDAVRDNPAARANAIEESLRLEPAAAMVDRYTTAAVSLAGAEIPARELVTVSLCAANRDEAVFPDPNRFDPFRPRADTSHGAQDRAAPRPLRQSVRRGTTTRP